jgi:hypothetical protein
MTQSQLTRAVARATGESIRTIHARGFGPVTNDFEEREPLVLDWDEMEASQFGVFPQRSRQAALT